VGGASRDPDKENYSPWLDPFQMLVNMRDTWRREIDLKVETPGNGGWGRVPGLVRQARRP
jgi:hypothetical protein